MSQKFHILNRRSVIKRYFCESKYFEFIQHTNTFLLFYAISDKNSNIPNEIIIVIYPLDLCKNIKDHYTEN